MDECIYVVGSLERVAAAASGLVSGWVFTGVGFLRFFRSQPGSFSAHVSRHDVEEVGPIEKKN